MTVSFSTATRQNLSLIIGVCGATGSGKTFTALRLATGLAGGKKFAVIDTENGRAKHYAPLPGEDAVKSKTFDFDHASITAPFTPDNYKEAIIAADKAGYPVIVVDSMSHEHAGDGGLLDMHDAFLDMKVSNAKKYNDNRPEHKIRAGNNMAGWIKPKAEHKRMMTKLLQVKAHIIMCFRAEQKIDMVKDDRGNLKIVPKESLIGADGWIPIAEKTLPFELTTSVLLVPNAPGRPLPIKIEEEHRQFFPRDKVITEEAGEAMGKWAKGGSVSKPRKETPAPSAPEVSPEPAPQASAPEPETEPVNEPPDDDDVDIHDLKERAVAAAEVGYDALEEFWMGLEGAEKKALKPFSQAYKDHAHEVDQGAQL